MLGFDLGIVMSIRNTIENKQVAHVIDKVVMTV